MAQFKRMVKDTLLAYHSQTGRFPATNEELLLSGDDPKMKEISGRLVIVSSSKDQIRVKMANANRSAWDNLAISVMH